MGNFAALVRRELGAYFASALAYVLLTVILLACGEIFLQQLTIVQLQRLPLRFAEYFTSLLGFLTLAAPLITMGLISEERNRGTLETLMTAPVSNFQFVLSKFFAAIFFLHVLLLVPMVGYPVLVGSHAKVDVGAVFGAYLGIVLVCSALFSIGLFVSALCRTQVSAGIITFVIALLLMMMNMVAMQAEPGGLLRLVLLRLDLFIGAQGLMRGVGDTRDVVYYLGVTGMFLFLTRQALETRRWK